MAQGSLHICADLSEPSLPAYTIYECRCRHRQTFTPQSAWEFVMGIFAYVINTKISPAGPYLDIVTNSSPEKIKTSSPIRLRVSR